MKKQDMTKEKALVELALERNPIDVQESDLGEFFEAQTNICPEVRVFDESISGAKEKLTEQLVEMCFYDLKFKRRLIDLVSDSSEKKVIRDRSKAFTDRNVGY